MQTVQSKSETKLAWLENPRQELVRLAWPTAVSMLSYSVMTLVDTLFVGQLGADALAGVGLGGTLAFVLLAYPIGLLRAIKVLVAQSVGRGNSGVAYLSTGILVAGALGLLVSVIGFTIAPVCEWITHGESAGKFAAQYLRIRSLGAVVFLVYAALREAQYGLGDSKTPMIASLSGCLINIIMDAVFVFGFHLGVVGVAWATLIAQATEMTVCLKVQWHRGFGTRRPKRSHLLSVLRIGLPIGLQFVLEIGSFALLAAMIAAMDAVQMAGHQIAIHIVLFSFLPALAISEATCVMVGQAVGAKRLDLVRPLGRLGSLAAFCYTGLCTLVFVFFASSIVACFNPDPQVRRCAASLLLIAALFQIADAANAMARGVLRGCADVRWPALIGITTSWLCTPPLAWYFGYHLGLEAMGGWLGLCIEIFVCAILLWRRILTNQWHRAVHLSRQDVEKANSEESDETSHPQVVIETG